MCLLSNTMFITHPLTIQEVNDLISERFVRIFGNIVEHFPTAAILILKKRPFQDVSDIVKAINDLLDELKTQEKEQILQSHPDIIENLTLTDFLHVDKGESRCLTGEDKMKLMDLNKRYKEKFGFPFIVSSEKEDVYNIFTELVNRIQNTRDEEMKVAMKKVKDLVSLRIHELVQ